MRYLGRIRQFEKYLGKVLAASLYFTFRFLFSHLTHCDKRWFRVTTSDFIYPGGPLKALNATISCIRVSDVGYLSKGGGFFIKIGGIGHTSVVIQFISLWNKPMKYFIEVFGVYPNVSPIRRNTLAWYMPTNNPKVIKLMRKYLIGTSRSDGSPVFHPIKSEYINMLVNLPRTLPDGRRYYARNKRNFGKRLLIPRVVNYNTFYITSKLKETMFTMRSDFNKRSESMVVSNKWSHFLYSKFYPKPLIIVLPTTVKTTTDCMKPLYYTRVKITF